MRPSVEVRINVHHQLPANGIGVEPSLVSYSLRGEIIQDRHEEVLRREIRCYSLKVSPVEPCPPAVEFQEGPVSQLCPEVLSAEPPEVIIAETVVRVVEPDQRMDI